MNRRAIWSTGLVFLASVTTSPAFEFSDLLSPFRGAVRLVTGLIPFVGDDKEPEASQPTGSVAEESPGLQQAVGTVRFAYDQFVLIYTPVKTDVPAGTKLTTVGKDGLPGGTQLAMSGERKGTFLVADVIHGEPKAGDLVVTVPKMRGATVADYQVLD